MRIVTWNMGRRAGAWDYLVNRIKPDYALLQETFFDHGRPGHLWGRPIGASSTKHGERADYRWGSAVWERGDQLVPVDLGVHGGWVQACRREGSDPLLLISVHVELDREGRSIPMLRRILSDLTALLESPNAAVIFGGDLNADVEFDRRHDTRRHSLVFERIEEFGLLHCNRLIPPGRPGTFRPDPPVTDDHIFFSHSLAGRVVYCDVLADEDTPSDHFPVIVEIDA